MRFLLLTILSGVVTFTTGCPQGPSKKLPGVKDTGSLVADINSYLTTAQGNFNAAILADPLDTTGKAQRIRNDALDDVLAVIDDNYTNYISNIETHRSTTDFLLDVIDLGSGAATGITKGERPNQILGIGLTAFRGGRKSAELNFYKQQTTPILITKMDDNRSTIMGDILQKRSESGANYSMKAAIRDMVNYYNAGTLVRAFTELSKSTAAQAQASQTRVRELSGPITKSPIPSMDQDAVLAQIDTHKISLARQIKNAKTATPLAAPGAPPAVAATALAAQNNALEPVRLKLQTIWTDIEKNSKFAAAITQVKTTPDAAIIAKINANPSAVSADEYLTLLFAVQGALNKDLDLNRELLVILRAANS